MGDSLPEGPDVSAGRCDASIVIPTLNEAGNVDELLRRVLEAAGCDVGRVEIVVVDGGSTDGTQQIIKEYMQDIPGELHESPWVNFEHNRNEALSLAKGKGDYLLFIDADEELQYDSDFELPYLDKDL